jgi:hypothetical protein
MSYCPTCGTPGCLGSNDEWESTPGWDLSHQEVHALIEWHDSEAQIANSFDADHVADTKRHAERANDLYFMLTGAHRRFAFQANPIGKQE